MGAQLQSCGKICSGEQSTGSKVRPVETTPNSKLEAYIPAAYAYGYVDPEPEEKTAPEPIETKADSDDWNGRVKGTPILDEGFICMGSMAPHCPTPPQQTRSGPIDLDVLQGSWVGSSGAQISVLGTVVHLNGAVLKAHGVELWDDGTVRSIGRMWQLEGWAEEGDGAIAWRASSTRENMESARSETWTPKSNLNEGITDRLKLLGYAGAMRDFDKGSRGVEGCCPGTIGAELEGTGYNSKKDIEDCSLLATLIDQWREPVVPKIRPRQVLPDFTNRAETGLGVELIHFIATQMKLKGFQKREGKKGHDIPVVVRQPPGSELYSEAITLWKARVKEEDGFPRVRVGPDEEYFSSLGNGHFFQALNCFDCSMVNINNSNMQYLVGKDVLLKEALSDGVPSIVLKPTTPKPVRAKVAQLLNSKRDFHWSLDEDGKVNTSSMHSREDDKVSQFEWLSKGMDAHQVDCLVRQHLGITDSHRIMG